MKAPDSRGDIIIEYEHYKVHDSEMYNTGYYFTVTSASIAEFTFQTGSTRPHVKMQVGCSGQSIVKLYEGITVSVNGSSVSVYNMDRGSTKSCSAVFFHTPTWSTNTEVLLDTILLPGGNLPAGKIGGDARTYTEWILETSTKYLIRIENQAGTTIGSTLNIQFYECAS